MQPDKPVNGRDRRRMTVTEMWLVVALIGQIITFVWGAATLKATIESNLVATNTALVAVRESVTELKIEMRDNRVATTQLSIDVGEIRGAKK